MVQTGSGVPRALPAGGGGVKLPGCEADNSPPTSAEVKVKVKVKVILRPTICRPVRLGIRHPPGTRDHFFPFSIFFYSFGFVDVGRPL
jgi:hypothetical protein